jgi:hypothetical protein
MSGMADPGSVTRAEMVAEEEVRLEAGRMEMVAGVGGGWAAL